MINLDRYASPGEARAARQLVRRALAMGWAVSVHDGEEWTVRCSTDESSILAALATTDSDTLRFRTPEGALVGAAYLVWGNARDGSELVADYSMSGPAFENFMEAGE